MNNTVEAKRLHLYLEGCLSAVSKVTLNTGDLGCLVRILEEFNAKSTVNPVNPPELKTAEEIAMEIDHGCVGWSPNKAHFNRVLAISIVSQAMQQAYAAGREDERQRVLRRIDEVGAKADEFLKSRLKAAPQGDAEQPKKEI